MATYSVYQKKVNQKGEAPLYIRFYIGRQKIEVPAKISLPPIFFDKTKGIVKTSHEFAKDKNLIISDIKATINDIFVKYRLKNNELTPDLFWREYRSHKDYSDFFSFCEAYQKMRFLEIAEGTKKKHITCLKTLREFKQKIYFSELNTDLFRQFVLYLRHKRKNNEVTINKTIQVISVYLNDAVKRELLPENPVRNLKLRGCRETAAEALTEAELNVLTNLYRRNYFDDNTHQALEFFLFLCFSSLHIADAKALTIEQISETEFTYIRAKMMNVRPRVVHVPIAEPLRKIIELKKGDREKGKLFEHILSDQKINKHLKIIAEAAGINKKLSAKVGRHTFATIFLRRTRDLNALRDIMGHSNIKQTLVYSHVLDNDRQEGIKVFNDFAI
jgi:site-specific recombinase XerD